jgi:proteasome accessory factor C
MDKFDRIYRLHQIFSGRRTALTLSDLMERLDCSKATVHRLLDTLRDYLGAPIVFGRDLGGYRYRASANEPKYELPGLWFSGEELQALVVLQRMLEFLEPGLLMDHLSPLEARITDLTRHRRLGLDETARRIRIIGIAHRPLGQCFMPSRLRRCRGSVSSLATTPDPRMREPGGESRRNGSPSTGTTGISMRSSEVPRSRGRRIAGL